MRGYPHWSPRNSAGPCWPTCGTGGRRSWWPGSTSRRRPRFASCVTTCSAGRRRSAECGSGTCGPCHELGSRGRYTSDGWGPAVPEDINEPAQVGVTGLAVMGANLARNLARHGYRVAVHNRNPERTHTLIAEHGGDGTFIPAESVEDFVRVLERPRKIIIMVKAGGPTDAVIDQLVPLLEQGDIVVDAGNAHFADTQRREAALRERGLHFVGSGVSGGEEGALNGPSIMPGGSPESYQALGPMLESIAAQVDGTPCCAHIGPGGAGHFVKMVHNGIEYADMQLIAEAYDLLRSGAGLAPDEIAKVFHGWNEGDLESFLIEITAEVLG